MKEKILSVLFKEYKEKLDTEYNNKIRLYEATLDTRDVVRERLKGVRPGHTENGNFLLNRIAAMSLSDRLDFLSKAHAVVDNQSVKDIIEYLITECMISSTLLAESMVDVNFQRATINGLELFEQEIQFYAKMYEEEKKRSDHITREDSLEAI